MSIGLTDGLSNKSTKLTGVSCYRNYGKALQLIQKGLYRKKKPQKALPKAMRKQKTQTAFCLHLYFSISILPSCTVAA